MNSLIPVFPSAICNVMLNEKYKKLASQTIIIENKTDVADFNFIVEYPKDNFTVFIVKIKFEDSENECKVLYRIDDNNPSIIELIIYNADDNKMYNSVIFCDTRKIVDINNKSFYIKPKITINGGGIKEITIDLFAE